MPSLSDLTSQCIRCGFCLEACPTFVLSGRETESPRGRIYLARSADEGKVEWEETRHALDTCLGCRACEPACPSGVKYGEILEQARDTLGAKPGVKNLIDGLSDPAAVRRQLALSRLWPGSKVPGFVSKGLSDEPSVADLPRSPKKRDWPSIDESTLPSIKGRVAILEGCVMRVLYPDVHIALRRLLRRIGYTVVENDAGCCGALHAHNGMLDEAHQKVEALSRELPKDVPLIVDSAGCGSWLKDSIGREARVVDASEFLLANGLIDQLKASPGLDLTVTYHDACHLAHGQRIKDEPRALIQAIPGLTFVELVESDMCCGSAGVYNLTQPGYAKRLLDRKWANVLATGAEIVATGNPGCHAWIEQASREAGGRVKVVHTLDLLEASFTGLVGQ